MAPGLWSDRLSSLAETLNSRQMKSGGWAYFDSVQESLEATCFGGFLKLRAYAYRDWLHYTSRDPNDTSHFGREEGRD